MTPESESDGRRRVAEDAAFWLLSLQSEQLSADQREQFGDWLRRSPLHIAEMLRVSQLQRDLSAFKDWHLIAPSQSVADSNVVALSPQSVTAERTRHWQPRRALMLAAAAAAVLIISAILVWVPGGQEYGTQPGERRAVTLADGSMVELAPDSRVSVKYRTHERQIILQRGEALFRVAKNPERPFIVQAVSTRVRAVGTVFQVGRDEQGVVVTVIEGRIAVTTKPDVSASTGRSLANPSELDLVANQQVSVSARGVADAVHTVEGDAEVAWTMDQFRFENQTVADVARRFNQYNEIKVEVRDPRIAERRISGVLRIGDPESFVVFIQAATDTRVSRPDPNHFVLQSPAAGPDAIP